MFQPKAAFAGIAALTQIPGWVEPNSASIPDTHSYMDLNSTASPCLFNRPAESKAIPKTNEDLGPLNFGTHILILLSSGVV